MSSAMTGTGTVLRSGSPGRHPHTVLIVDDEPSITRALAIACKRAGYDVLATTSGEQAQSYLATQVVDAMIVDLRMPDLRGDVLFHLATARQPHLKRQTLFTTGDVSPRAQELIAACGCPFLRKPFELSDVLQTLRALLPLAQTA
jgi:DNA-binding NtrC family response regulator